MHARGHADHLVLGALSATAVASLVPPYRRLGARSPAFAPTQRDALGPRSGHTSTTGTADVEPGARSRGGGPSQLAPVVGRGRSGASYRAGPEVVTEGEQVFGHLYRALAQIAQYTGDPCGFRVLVGRAGTVLR